MIVSVGFPIPQIKFPPPQIPHVLSKPVQPPRINPPKINIHIEHEPINTPPNLGGIANVLPNRQASSSNKNSIDDFLQTVGDDFCHSKQCVISASKMEHLIDWNINPCDDFYSFACGRFVEGSTLHDRRDTLNIFSITNDKLKEQLRRLFATKIESNEIKPYQMVKLLFTSCMNTYKLEARGFAPLKELISAIGGWPMLGNWNENIFDLEQAILKLRAKISGVNSNLFRQRKIFDLLFRDSSFRDTESDNSSSNRKGKSSSSIFQAYRTLAVDTAVVLGATRYVVESQIDDMLNFYQELLQLNSQLEIKVLTIGDSSDIDSELYVKFALFQWLDHFLPPPFSIEKSTLTLSKIEFFEAFEKLLSRTSKQTLANFFILRIVGFSSQFMTSELKTQALKFKTEVYGVKQNEQWWIQCVDVVSKSLELASEAIFSKKYFDLDAKETAVEIALRVKQVYEKKLAASNYLSQEMKAKALLKINKIIAILEFPRELLSDRMVELFYRKVSIEPADQFLESVLKLAIFNADRKLVVMQNGLNLKAGDKDGAGVLNSVDVKDFNKICEHTLDNL